LCMPEPPVQQDTDITAEALVHRFTSGRAVVGVIGLGYVGLPFAVAFGEAGLSVLGFDIQPERVWAFNDGRSYMADVSSERLAAAVRTSRVTATEDRSRLAEADALIICVPTPLTKSREPDLSYVIQEAEEIARYLRPGQLVVLMSTTFPGTTEEIVLPILSRSGLHVERDFYLAYCPERLDPGNRAFNIRTTPRLVGGIGRVSTRVVRALYSHVTDNIVSVASPRIAEMAKVFENVFRSVNIALVNELTQLCEKMNLSVWDVIDAAKTKPYGFMPFYPGPGVGGHCIPLDPYYLASKAREYDFHTRFIELAADINEQMPQYVARRVAALLNDRLKVLKHARILLLGVAYKRDLGDVRESPVLRLMAILRSWGAAVSYHDPYVPEVRIDGIRITSVPLGHEQLGDADCVVISTDHSAVDYASVIAHAALVFDARGVTRGLPSAPNVVRL
jgi:UDP-N-acetyl-D-glucosamine dehydrogenase